MQSRFLQTSVKFFRTSAIYGAFVFRAFSFILLFPILTRVITPATWGGILAAQSLATWLAILLDFGFTTFLIRMIAADREDTLKIRKGVGDVYSAKVVLLVIAFLICYLTTISGILHHFPAFAWWSLALAIAQGFGPLWYYQSIEKMYFFSVIDIFGRILYIVLAILLIHRTENAYLVLVLQAVTLLLVNVITIPRLWREVGGFSFSLPGAWRVLREGIVLSGFSILTSVYTSASTFLFGLFAPVVSVSLYGNADKLVRSGTSLLLVPLSQILIPRSVRAFAQSKNEGFQVARQFLLIYLIISLSGLIIGWLVSPIAINLVFGVKYAGTLIYFRWLLFLLPLTAVNTVLVNHILIPVNKEDLVVKIYALITIIALVLIAVLVPRYGGQGMVYSMITPEITALILLSLGSYRLLDQASLQKIKLSK